MKKTINTKELIEHLDRLTHEISQIKSILVYQAQPDEAKSNEAWDDLMKASNEISDLWSRSSALEKIRYQRGV
jgi:hypothetical protein